MQTPKRHKINQMKSRKGKFYTAQIFDLIAFTPLAANDEKCNLADDKQRPTRTRQISCDKLQT